LSLINWTFDNATSSSTKAEAETEPFKLNKRAK
jgi:hypothetical protein